MADPKKKKKDEEEELKPPSRPPIGLDGEPIRPIHKPRGYRPAQEEGMETGPLGADKGLQYDPVETASWLAAGALGGRALGPWGMLAGGVGGALSDIAMQATTAGTEGLPWWLKLPAELAAGALGGHYGAKTINKLRPKGRIPFANDVAEGLRGAGRELTDRSKNPFTEEMWQQLLDRDAPPPPVRPFTISELLESAKQSQAPVSRETLADRILNQAKNIDVGGHRPGFLESAEERIRRRIYPAVETRPLYEPTQIPSKEYSPAELAARRIAEAAKTSVEPPAEVLGPPLPPNYKAPSSKVKPERPPVQGPPGPPGTVGPKEPLPSPDQPAAPRNVWQDVRGWLTDANDYVGYYSKPVLSALERLAERTGVTEVGKELTALEGKRSARADQIWVDLFDSLAQDLKALPKQLHDNFIDTLEGKAVASTPQVERAIAHFRSVFGEEGSALLAQQNAGLHIDPLEHYFMHEFEPAFVRALQNDPTRQSELARKMVADGDALNVAEAKRMISDFLSRPSRAIYRERKVGSEFDRTKNLAGYIRDPLKAVTMRGKAISRRLAGLEVYGPKQERVRQLIDAFGGDDAQRAAHLFRLTMGPDPVDEGMRRVASSLMSFNAITSLSLSGIMNMSQPTLLMLRTSIPNLARATFSFLAHPRESMAYAQQLGIYADMAQRQLYRELAGGVTNRITRGALGLFNLTERYVRAIAAEAGKDWTRTLHEKYLSHFDSLPQEAQNWVLRELRNLNFTKEEISRIVASKGFTPNDVKLASWSIADQTAFMPRSGRKSEFYLTSPMGPLIMQFKGFLLNTGRLLKTAIIDEYKAGNPQPLYRAIGIVLPTMVAAGEIPADLNALARGSHRAPLDWSRPGSIGWRALDNISQIGALGLGLGMLNEMTGLKPAGFSDLSNLLAGPTITSLGQEFQAPAKSVYYALKGDTPEAARQVYETGRRIIRRLPYAGPMATSLGMPSSSRSASEGMDNWIDRLGFSQRVVTRARLKELNARLQHMR